MEADPALNLEPPSSPLLPPSSPMVLQLSESESDQDGPKEDLDESCLWWEAGETDKKEDEPEDRVPDGESTIDGKTSLR